MKIPPPDHNPADEPETIRVPKTDPDMSAIGKELEPRIEAHVLKIWTTLYRAYHSKNERWSEIDGETVKCMFWDVWLDPNSEALTADEINDLELFEEALSKNRTLDRVFTDLTATETSFVRILVRGYQRLNGAEATADTDASKVSRYNDDASSANYDVIQPLFHQIYKLVNTCLN